MVEIKNSDPQQSTTMLLLGSGRLIKEYQVWNLASNDEQNLRRMALAVNYQMFVQLLRFANIPAILKEEFKRSNTTTGTYFTPPTRTQILGRLREEKLRQFKRIWSEVELRDNFDLFQYLREESLESIIYRRKSKMVIPIYGSRIKLSKEKAIIIAEMTKNNQQLPFSIPLPPTLEACLFPTKENYNPEDELPF